MNEIKKLELLTEQEINEIKNETKRKLNMLDDKIRNVRNVRYRFNDFRIKIISKRNNKRNKNTESFYFVYFILILKTVF